MTDKYINGVEWDLLQDSIILRKFERSTKLPDGVETIELFRDDSYKLKAVIKGSVTKQPVTTRNSGDEGVPGSRVIPFSVEGYTLTNSSKYELNHCYIGNVRELIDTYSRTLYGHFEIDLMVHEVLMTTPIELEVAWLTEFFINGPTDERFMFPRITKRVYSNHFTRERVTVDGDPTEFLGTKSMSSSSDFAYIETDDVSFIVTKVPKEFGPSWSKNIAIEYRKEWGIPNQEVRKSISEVVSFLFGRQLLNVGYSEFGSRGEYIRKSAWSPWGDNVVAVCQKASLPPINFSYSDWDNFENTLKQIVPRYIMLSNELKLSDVLWRYWIFLNHPLGTNLPILQSGIEMLSKSWVRSNNSRRKGVYLPKKEFDALLSDEISSVAEKLAGIEFGDRILRKISGAFQMTQNEMLYSFFDEIDLQIGDVENQALRGRNKMSHGHSSKEDNDYNVYLTFAYRTFFNRIILKILGYDGMYIDYSTEGWPERHIDEPLGGTERFLERELRGT